MRIILLTALAGLIYMSGYSQDEIIVQKLQDDIARSIKKDISDTTPWKWLKGGNINLNGTQGSLRNWAAGGDKFAMAINSYVNYFFFYRNGRQNWDNNIDFNFGLLQSTSTGTRKNDDRFDILSKYGYNLNKRWYLSALFNFRTQLFDGYTYSDTTPNTFSSTFLSPAYITTSIGFDYKPTGNFSAFISPATNRLVLVANKQLSKIGAYGVDSGRHAINEFGAFATLNFIRPIGSNITYKGRLDFFSNYRKNPENVDFYFTNYFTFKINKYFSASYNLDLIYDDDIRIFGKEGKSPGLQLKSLIGLGFVFKLK